MSEISVTVSGDQIVVTVDPSPVAVSVVGQQGPAAPVLSDHTQVVFNDSGQAIGDARFTWNNTLGILNVTGAAIRAGEDTTLGWEDAYLQRHAAGSVSLRDASDALASFKASGLELSTDWRLYNLGDSDAADTEYARASWAGNAFRLGTFKSGTGASRAWAFFVGGSQVGAFDTGGALHVQGGASGFTASEMVLRWDGSAGGYVQTYSQPLYLNALGNTVIVGPTGLLNTGPLYIGPSGTNATLVGEGSNILALRNALNSQTLRIYKAYEDGSNYANLSVEWNGNEFHLRTRNAGSHGGTASPIGFYPDGSLYLGAGGFVSCWEVAASDGHMLPHGTTNTRDLGSPIRLVRNGYFGVSVIAPTHQTTDTTVDSLPAASASTRGQRRHVTDSSVAASGNFGASVTGGGSNVVPVYCTGSAWIIA